MESRPQSERVVPLQLVLVTNQLRMEDEIRKSRKAAFQFRVFVLRNQEPNDVLTASIAIEDRSRGFAVRSCFLAVQT